MHIQAFMFLIQAWILRLFCIIQSLLVKYYYFMKKKKLDDVDFDLHT